MRWFLLSGGLFMAAAPAWAGEPSPWGLWSQPPASPVMQRIETLHTEITVIIVGVVVLVFALLGIVMVRYRASRSPSPARFAHNTPIEIVWTLVPALILTVIAFPSLGLLRAMSVVPDAAMTLKVTGHQWYWTYSYPDHGVSFDAAMVQDSELKPGQPRLLATDNNVVLPVGVPIRVQITSDDVVHSWSVPAFGVKTDAIPGRLNETWVTIDKEGLYYGQCSQICGINHGFMPIAVEAVPAEVFADWVKARGSGNAARPPQGQLAAGETGGTP